VNENESELKPLGLDEYEAIEKRALEIERKSILTDCEACGIGGLEKLTKLRSIDPWMQVYNYLASKEGAYAAISKSAVKAGLDGAAVANSYDIVDATNLARSLVGMERRVAVEDRRKLDLAAELTDLVGRAIDAGKVDDDWVVAAKALTGRDKPHPNSPTSAAS
jgi:hypothetical protein